MTRVLYFIQNNINVVIFVFGIVVSLGLLWNGLVLSGKKSRIEEMLDRNPGKYYKNLLTRELIEKEDTDAAVKPDDIRKLETQFNGACAIHGVLVQLIPIFPLFGILGTVAGLMLEVQAGDISAVMASLSTALTSTLWGLIFAIVLKLLEAVFPSRVINSVDVMLDDFYRKMNMAEMFRDFTNEK